MTISIRRATPGDAPGIARVRVDSWRTTYRGLIPDAYLDGMKVEDSTTLWQRVLGAGKNDTSVFVADNDGEVIGFAAANMLGEPREGINAELSAVYVQREYHHAGIGRRLVGAVARMQREHGANGLIVWTIAGNKLARDFYEALGGVLLVEQPFEWDGMPLVEAGYGFTDIAELIAACEAVAGPRDSSVH